MKVTLRVCLERLAKYFSVKSTTYDSGSPQYWYNAGRANAYLSLLERLPDDTLKNVNVEMEENPNEREILSTVR